MTTGCAILPFVSGCLSDPGTNGGLLQVFETAAPSDATVIEAADNRIQSVEPVQKGLQQAASETSSVAEVEVTEREYDAVAAAFSTLPWYDRFERNSDNISGIYIRYADTVSVVVLTPFCTDSLIVDAKSERGEYGWGGCYDRKEWGY